MPFEFIDHRDCEILHRNMALALRVAEELIGAEPRRPVRVPGAKSADGERKVQSRSVSALSLSRKRRPRRKDRPVCGAKTRAGGTCLVRVEFGKARCRFHGGLSTGPKTEAGRARIAEAQRRRWRAYREKRQMSVAS
jgi:hypothetical protein